MADLWIRTQEGANCYDNNQNTLIQCTNIIEENGSLLTIQDNKTYLLGTYDTKERAKEILDEIQKLLVQPAAFLKADMPQGFPLEVANEYIKQINEFCGQNNLLYVGSKNCEIIPTNNTNIVFTMPEE